MRAPHGARQRRRSAVRALLLSLLLAALPAHTSPRNVPQLPCVSSIVGSKAMAVRYSAVYCVEPDADGQIMFGDTTGVYAVVQDGASNRLAGGGTTVSIPPAGLLPYDVQIGEARGLAYDAVRSALFISDVGYHRVLRLDFGTGMLTVYAGSADGKPGDCCDPGGVADSLLTNPHSIRLDRQRDLLYIADRGNQVVRVVDLTTAQTRVYAGTPGVAGHTGDEGPATAATLSNPTGLAVDEETGVVYVSELTGRSIRVISPDGIITTLAGVVNGPAEVSGDDGPASDATFEFPTGLALNPHTGSLFVADYFGSLVREITRDGLIRRYAGFKKARRFEGDGGPVGRALLYQPWDVTYDARFRRLLIADTDNNVVRIVNDSGIISTASSTRTALPQARAAAATSPVRLDVPRAIPATEFKLNLPFGIVTDCADDSIYVSDTSNDRVLRVDRNGAGSVFVGTLGSRGAEGDGGHVSAAQMYSPRDLVIDPDRRLLFIASLFAHVVRVVNMTDGIINTVLGVAYQNTNSGDGGLAKLATVREPYRLAVDPAGGRLFVAPRDSHCVRVVAYGGDGRVTLAAGKPGVGGYAGDGGPATSALFDGIEALAWDPNTELLYVAEANNRVVRAVFAPVGQPIGAAITLVGNPGGPYLFYASGGVGTALDYEFGRLSGMAIDVPRRRLFLTDDSFKGVYAVELETGAARVVGGSTAVSTAGDGSNPLDVTFEYVYGIGTDCHGGLLLLEPVAVRHLVNIAGPNEGTPCPRGYYCPCGRRPISCDDPAQFCPADAIAPFNVSSGSKPLPITPEEVLGTGGGYGDQTSCERGTFCYRGVQAPCPVGTYGMYQRQVTAAGGCLACPPGTYQPQEGVAVPGPATPDSPFKACIRCPPGSYAPSPGAQFCTLCHANSIGRVEGATSAAEACEPCPAGSWSLPGATVCIPLRDIDAAAGDEDGVNVQRLLPFDPQAWDFWGDVLTIVLPLILIASIPLQAALFIRYAPRRLRIMWVDFLSRIDSTGLSHPVQPGEAPLKTPTSIGGGATVLFVGVFIAFAALLIQQYRVSSKVVQSLLPISFGDLGPMAVVPAHAAPVPEFESFAPGLSSGFSVVLHAAGADCANLTSYSLNLFDGSVKLATSYDNTTGAVRHVFHCADCIVSARSELQLFFPRTCVSFTVTAVAVGAWGRLGASSIFVPDAPSVTVSFPLALELVQDTIDGDENGPFKVLVGGRSARGWKLSPGAVTPRSDALPGLTGASLQPTVSITLPLETTYTRVQLEPPSTAVDVTSAIVNLSPILAIPKLIIAILFRARKTRQIRERMAGLAALGMRVGGGGGGGGPGGGVGLSAAGSVGGSSGRRSMRLAASLALHPWLADDMPSDDEEEDEKWRPKKPRPEDENDGGPPPPRSGLSSSLRSASTRFFASSGGSASPSKRKVVPDSSYFDDGGPPPPKTPAPPTLLAAITEDGGSEGGGSSRGSPSSPIGRSPGPSPGASPGAADAFTPGSLGGASGVNGGSNVGVALAPATPPLSALGVVSLAGYRDALDATVQAASEGGGAPAPAPAAVSVSPAPAAPSSSLAATAAFMFGAPLPSVTSETTTATGTSPAASPAQPVTTTTPAGRRAPPFRLAFASKAAL